MSNAIPKGKGVTNRGLVLIDKRFARAVLLVLLAGWAGMAFSAGNTVSWGSNDRGQLGIGFSGNAATPQAVLTSLGALKGKTVTQVSAGYAHTCALTSDGRVACWGSNDHGQLGNGSTSDLAVPIEVDTTGVLAGKTVTQISAGEIHTCALTSDGLVACWGRGPLGNGGWSESAVPVAVDASGVLAGKTVTQVSAAGSFHTCALTSDGQVACWGGNYRGELGNGGTSASAVPVAVDASGVLASKTVIQVSAGGYHTCALTSDGLVTCWGSGGSGQLGNGGRSESAVPVAVDASGVLAGKTVTRVSAGDYHTCALTSDGRVACWGDGGSGQLGNGGTADSSVPVAVDASGVLAGKTVTQVSAGRGHTCALTSDGQVACWGSNSSGRLGNGNTSASAVPVAVDASGVLTGKTVTQASAGGFHTCALTSDSRVACWGANYHGQLGNGGTNYLALPVAVDASGVLAGKTVTQISAGGSDGWGSAWGSAVGNPDGAHSCALTSDGLVACWGSNDHGQLGNGNTSDSAVPVAVDNNGVLAGKTVTQISAGNQHTCALTSDGLVTCWGRNDFGQLGNGGNSDSVLPVAVDASGVLAGRSVTQVSAGGVHTCALSSDGQVACWGWNVSGELGNGGTRNSAVPVAMDASGVLAGKTVTQVSAGQAHTCALTSDGQVACWGWNVSGGLGNGGTANSSVPVAVDASGVLAGKTVTQINAAGNQHTCALTSDGLVACWGGNYFGQLGNGGTANSSVPVAMDASGVLAGKTVTQVSAGEYHTCALTSDGRVACWGANYFGQLGNGGTSDSAVPVAADAIGVLTGKIVTQVSAGFLQTFALSNTNIPTGLKALVTVGDKAYDGNAAGSITGCVLFPLTAGMDCDPSGASAAFADASAGAGKPVRVTGLRLTGSSDYVLINPDTHTVASIRRAPQAALTVSADPPSFFSGGPGTTLGYAGGTINGSVAYQVSGSPASLTCKISGSTLTAIGGAGTCSVTATMAGNANYEPVTSAVLDVPVVGGVLTGLAAQGYVGTNNQVQFGAFTISGESRRVLIRGLGPALDGYVPNAIRNPKIALSINGELAPLEVNDDWADADNADEIATFKHQPKNEKESAILRTLEPGVYNVHLSGSGGTEGIGMFQVYAVEGGGNGELKGLAAQGQVGTGNQVQFGAFTITGGPRKVLIRGLGPALDPYILGAIRDPKIALSLNGALMPLEVNDDWADADNAAEIMALKHQPKNATESAILRTLEPGIYNVHLSGSGGTEGIGMFQVYTVE